MDWKSRNIFSHRDRIEQIRNTGLCIPSYATIHLSYSCNQNCFSCAFAKYNQSNFIPQEESVFKYINDLMEYGIKMFEFSGGGEPTTVLYLNKIIEHILDCGCNYSVITNGTLLNKSLLALFSNTATFVRISLETGDRDLYLKYKGVSGSQFDIAVGNIKYLVCNKNPDTEISIKFGIDKVLNSEYHLEDSIKIAEECGVKFIQFRPMTGINELCPNGKKKVLEELNVFRKITNINIVDSLNMDNNISKCWLNPLYTTIDGNGFIYLCCYYYNGLDYIIGNLDDKSFKEIWESDYHKELIEKIDTKNCSKFNCRFIGYHEVVEKEMKRGRMYCI